MEDYNGHFKMVRKVKSVFVRRKIFLKNLAQLILGFLGFYFGVYKVSLLEAEVKMMNEKIVRHEFQKDSLIKLNQELKLSLADVVVKIAEDNYDINDIPFPMGYKVKGDDGKLRMVKVNRAYRIKYGISNNAYFGNKDSQIHPRYGNDYELHDSIVMRGIDLIVHDFYENTILATKKHSIGRFFKWKLTKKETEYLYFLEMPS